MYRHFCMFLMLLGALLPSGCEKPESTPYDRSADARIMKHFNGLDLEQIDVHDHKRLEEAIRRFRTTSVMSPTEGPYALKYIWDCSLADASPHYLLIEVVPGLPHPGTTPVLVTLMDSRGTTIAATEFTTGYRVYLRNSRIAQVDGIKWPVVEFELTNWNSKEGPSRMWCAAFGDRFDIIRLETEGGFPTRSNREPGPKPVTGPRFVQQSPDEWEADLASSDRKRVLRALVWLASSDPVALEVKKRPRTSNQLRELHKVGPEWEREMAGFALGADKKSR